LSHRWTATRRADGRRSARARRCSVGEAAPLSDELMRSTTPLAAAAHWRPRPAPASRPSTWCSAAGEVTSCGRGRGRAGLRPPGVRVVGAAVGQACARQVYVRVIDLFGLETGVRSGRRAQRQACCLTRCGDRLRRSSAETSHAASPGNGWFAEHVRVPSWPNWPSKFILQLVVFHGAVES